MRRDDRLERHQAQAAQQRDGGHSTALPGLSGRVVLRAGRSAHDPPPSLPELRAQASADEMSVLDRTGIEAASWQCSGAPVAPDGDNAGPRSRSPTVRAFIAKPKSPKVSAKVNPW